MNGVGLDPLVGLGDPDKPLRSRLLAVPALRELYLRHVRTLAEQWLDWGKLGPLVGRYRTLVGAEVERDVKKLYSNEDFQLVTGAGETSSEDSRWMSLRSFAEQRRS